jgi:4-amino-4-deoxy-L-arabinose transferase-like glycosyltransferase
MKINLKKIKKLISQNTEIILNIFLAIAIFYFILVNIIQIDNPLLDRHGFRQTQTALTSYWQTEGGLRFDYQTPVIGKPWMVPFEFPIFQSIVSITAIFIGNLDISGKLVSLLAALITIPYSWKILEEFKFKDNEIKIAHIIYFTMPTITFWSGTFMIESTALFFTLGAIYHFILAVQNKKFTINYIFFSVLLTFAFLQKVTTILVPFGMTGGLFLYHSMGSKIIKINFFEKFLLIVSAVLSCLIFVFWLRYSDSIKTEGEIAQHLTSNALAHWNYGGFDEFFNLQYWRSILLRAFSMNSAIILGPLFLSISIFKIGLKRNVKVVVCVILFFLPMLIFKPLHRVHDYYQYSNLIFLAVLMGHIIGGQIDGGRKYIMIYLTFIVVAINVIIFTGVYANSKFTKIHFNQNNTLKLSNYIKNHTTEGDVILTFGADWSSEISYYSQRRAVMVPDWYLMKDVNKNSIDVKNLFTNWSKYTDYYYKAMVLCGSYRENKDIINLFESTSQVDFDDCSVHIR